MWSLKKLVSTILGRKRDTEVEKKHMDTKVGNGGIE